jgi:ketosteroid isomerase-like protein
MPEPFADAVRWPIDADGSRLRVSDRLVSRMPALQQRLAPRLLADPAGSRTRRWVLTRAVTAGFAATDRGDWAYLERIYEPDVVLRVAPETAPDLPATAEGFDAVRAVIETIYEIMATADTRPLEIIDLGGSHFVALNQVQGEGSYSGLEMNRAVVNVYEISTRGKAARQWSCVELATAERFYAERLAELESGVS